MSYVDSDIRIIKTGINVSKILKQLQEYPEDWGSQKNINDTEQLDPTKYLVTADVLQLVVGGVNDPNDYVGDTEICIKTPAYDRHTEAVRFIKRNFHKHSRVAFLGLPVGGVVPAHIDFGTYYLTKDRYHLSIQGRYRYSVGDSVVDVEPGTLLWFDNKKNHGTVNIGNETRIALVFDVPHSKNNP